MQQPLPAGLTPLAWKEQDAQSLKVVSNTHPERLEDAVRQAREHIGVGDVFQLVLSQRFSEVSHDLFDLYRSLRMVNLPLHGFFSFNGWHLIGSSPEVMVKADPQDDGRVVALLRPIAGTCRRGSTAAEDQAPEAELLADPKERAEHVMLVDLGRNDLGGSASPAALRSKS